MICTSVTEARTLFKNIWSDMIGSMETVLQSDIQDEDSENGLADEVKIYANNILKNTSTTERLRKAIKSERSKLRMLGGRGVFWH